jgi:REP element-mobilizing transposase RayT
MDDRPVVAFHVVCCTYGFWLPNDPRGSCSTEVRAEELRPFGPATPVGERQSVAHLPHDFTLRRIAKEALKYPEVVLTGKQALSIGLGFREMTAKSGYVIHACSILPCHIHLVIRRHRYDIEQVVRLLRQAGTRRLLEDGLHPFAQLRTERGRLPSIWAQDFWKVFLCTEEEILERIAYVEENPLKEGKPRQRWSFVTPFDPEVSDAS